MTVSRTIVVSVAALTAAMSAAGLFTVARERGLNRLRRVPESTVSVSTLNVGPTPPMPPEIPRQDVPEVEVTEVARNLEVVWALRSSPDGRLFVTERRGRILVLKPESRELSAYAQVDTAVGGEHGLMGLALHPEFPREPWIYVMYTARKEGGGVNRVARLRDRGGSAVEEQVLLDDIPAAVNHDGGAIEFGPDGMLYIGTGDAMSPPLAQDLSQLNGKILRIAADGHVPPDNPFPRSSIWAYGFRNVSGLAFHPSTGELWAASHGPSATSPEKPRHMDSVYRVKKGSNHGWPAHLGVSGDPAIVSPTVFFVDRPVPPGGLAFYRGPASAFVNNLFMTVLGGQEIHRYVIGDGQTLMRIERWWPNRFGRLRAITVSADGSLYVGTSNRERRVTGNYPASDFIYRLQLREQRSRGNERSGMTKVAQMRDFTATLSAAVHVFPCKHPHDQLPGTRGTLIAKSSREPCDPSN